MRRSAVGAVALLMPLLTVLCTACGGGTSKHHAVMDDTIVLPSPSASPTVDDAIDVQPATTRHDGDKPRQVRPPIAPPSCPGTPDVYFSTPEAAMRYLATAWNHNDLDALCQVTNPNARFL